jgi:hypothetical protein
MSYDPQIYNFLLQSNHLPVQVADLKKIIVFVMNYTICLMGQIEIKYGSLTLSQIVYDWFCLGRFTKAGGGKFTPGANLAIRCVMTIVRIYYRGRRNRWPAGPWPVYLRSGQSN